MSTARPTDAVPHGPAALAAIQAALLSWFDQHARDLPWRRTRDPYRIMVSEVMLQQTQVDRVVPKYAAFLEAFPTLEALARAPTADVIRAWAGLGYNRRAVNMQRAAQVILNEYAGSFPRDVAALRRLPGVGPYTAGAIACFAFEQDVAFIDTNIRRVLQRVFAGPDDGAATDAQLLAIAERVLPPGRSWAWNQALMELGALICTGAAPACWRCPLHQQCAAYAAWRTADEQVFERAPQRHAAFARLPSGARLPTRARAVTIVGGSSRRCGSSMPAPRSHSTSSGRWSSLTMPLLMQPGWRHWSMGWRVMGCSCVMASVSACPVRRALSVVRGGGMTTAILLNPRQAEHDEPRHPERAARLHAVEAALDASGLYSALLVLDPEPASGAQLTRVHTPAMLALVQQAVDMGAWFDLDTYTSPRSWEVACLSTGAAIGAVRAVLSGQASNAFALVRPPGHHATPTRPMGFCLLNSVAVAAAEARATPGIERIAIVDYDVHHGNGTQDCFYDRGEVLFCSSHAAPLFPGTGMIDEIGAGSGLGTTLNIPLPYRTGDFGIQQIYEQVVIPALRRFQPQLILVSAGFDAHWADPIGPLSLSVAGYAGLTRQLKDLAGELCDGRIVLVLEGGYDLDALGACVVAALHVLLGQADPPDPIGPARVPEADVSRLIAQLTSTHPLLV